jgi:Ca-activated chloride channel family protein
MARPFNCRGCLNSITVAAAAVLTAGVASTGAQFTSGVDAVEVYASVLDRAGQPVSGLTRADYTVLEDGQPQPLTTFAEADFPLSVAVAVDRSFSMRGTELAGARAAARTFVSSLRPEDEVMVVAVGSEVETVAPLSTNREAAERAIDGLQPWGTTGLYDAVIASLDAVQHAKGRRALVLLSDGSDRYGTATPDDALARARRADVMIYPFALGADRPPVFAELAVLTGGQSFHLRDFGKLTDAVRQIANELRHQYLLAYAPPRAADAPKTWHSITVRVNRPDVTVRARDGYLR